MVRSYIRNKHAVTIDCDDGTVLAQVTVEETSFMARIKMVVRVPELVISSIEGGIQEAFLDRCREMNPGLQQVVGLRIGSGIIKQVNSLIGGPNGCPRLADLVLECCDQVILRFTLDPLKEVLEKEGEEQIEAHRNFIRQNPRLINSCVAFADGSPLREGVEVEL